MHLHDYFILRKDEQKNMDHHNVHLINSQQVSKSITEMKAVLPAQRSMTGEKNFKEICFQYEIIFVLNHHNHCQ